MPPKVPDIVRQNLEDTLNTNTENADVQKQMKDLGIPGRLHDCNTVLRGLGHTGGAESLPVHHLCASLHRVPRRAAGDLPTIAAQLMRLGDTPAKSCATHISMPPDSRSVI